MPRSTLKLFGEPIYVSPLERERFADPQAEAHTDKRDSVERFREVLGESLELSTVRLCGFLVLFDACLMVMSSMGLRCVGTDPDDMA